MDMYSQTQFLDNIAKVEPRAEDASTLKQVMELLQFVADYDIIRISIEDIKNVPMEVLTEAWEITNRFTNYYGSKESGELIQEMNDVENVKDNLISIQSKFVADDDDFF